MHHTLISVPAGLASHVMANNLPIGAIHVETLSATNHIVAIRTVNRATCATVPGGIALDAKTLDEFALQWIRYRALEGQVVANINS